jgi:uncharacterized protein
VVLVFVTSMLMVLHRDYSIVRIGSVEIQVEIADSEEARQKGLSEKTSLADSQGMLFVFPHDAQWSIWMKNMKMPIDIVWLDTNKKVVHVASHVAPDTYPAHFTPPAQARYVLELASGVAAKNNMTPGVQTEFTVSSAAK